MNIKEYEKTVNELENKEIGAITKMYLVYLMIDYESYKELSDSNKEKLLDYLYTYYIETDFLYENSLHDVVELILNSRLVWIL